MCEFESRSGHYFFDIASVPFMHIALSVLIIRLKGFLFSDGFLNLISNDYHIIERAFSDNKEVIAGALILGFSLIILSIPAINHLSIHLQIHL